MSEASEKNIVSAEGEVVPFTSEYKSVQALHRQMAEEIELRRLLTAFIALHMKEGIDYGRIHFSSNCPNKYSPADCKVKGHWSKPCLFKPGSEKFCSLFKFKAQYKKDQDTWEMLGSRPGIIAYICHLVDSKGKIQGEGRGVADIRDKGDNTGVKIAEKRAKIDAVLSTGGLPDFFTQDLEDMAPEKREAAATSERPASRPAAKPTPGLKSPISYQSRVEITRICKAKGYELPALERYVRKAFGVKTYRLLTELQAKQVIMKLSAIPARKPAPSQAPEKPEPLKEEVSAAQSVEKQEEDQLAEEVL